MATMTEDFIDIWKKGGWTGVQQDITPKMLARRNDPSTSKRSAEMAIGLLNGHHGKIKAALELGDGTMYDVAERAQMRPSAVSRRLNEMEKLGMIYLTGEERLGETGRPCRVWRVKE